MSSINYNQQLFDKANQYIPGGVNSPVRAFKAVGGTPCFIEKAKGAYMWDANQSRYIDMIGSWGPMIAGHAHPYVLEKIGQALQNGSSFGAPTSLEVDLAQRICELMPAIEQIRLVSSGTEATMSAIRLARSYTNRDKIIKFNGGYHGHADSLLVKAGSGLMTFGTPSSGGILPDVAKHTLVLEYNSIEQITQAFSEFGEQIAGVIIEPIAGNMNYIPAKQEFLQTLRNLCNHYASVLIFDEVMTGFRVGLQGATHHYQINPDLICLGKVIGGGMPLAAFGGKRQIMQCLAPIGNTYQAGTLSGNPVAVTSGLATLDLVMQNGFYEQLSTMTRYFVDGVVERFQQKGIACVGDSMGGMFGLFIGLEALPNDLADVEAMDLNLFKQFFHGMLKHGVYLAPSAFESGFVSIMHTQTVMDEVLNAVDKALLEL